MEQGDGWQGKVIVKRNSIRLKPAEVFCESIATNEDKEEPDDTMIAGSLNVEELKNKIAEQENTIKTLQGIVNNHEEEKKVEKEEQKKFLEKMTKLGQFST